MTPHELVEQALAYPFESERRSFVLEGGEARELQPGAVADPERVAVLAFGANASPDVLADKLGSRAADARVPVVAGELQDFDVVYSAHVAPYGAIPGALQHSPGAVASVSVVHLLPHELAAVHRSEPNYVFARLRSIELRLEDGTSHGEVHAYITRHGCLQRDGAPVGVAEIPVAGRTWPALDQEAMLAAARDALAPDRELEDFVLAQALDSGIAGERTRALRSDAHPFAWADWEEVE